jgi:hypothetical protein
MDTSTLMLMRTAGASADSFRMHRSADVAVAGGLIFLSLQLCRLRELRQQRQRHRLRVGSI